MRCAYRGFHRGRLLRVEAEPGEREVGRQGFEAPQHEFFTEQRRQRTDPVVAARTAVDRDAQPAVLREPSLGDVHACEHLDPRDERVAQMKRRPRMFVQHAVDAQADAPAGFERFDVDVGCVAHACRVKRVRQQPHGRRVVELGRVERARCGDGRCIGMSGRRLRAQRRPGRSEMHVSRHAGRQLTVTSRWSRVAGGAGSRPFG